MPILRPAVVCAVGLLVLYAPVHAQSTPQSGAVPQDVVADEPAASPPATSVLKQDPKLEELIPETVLENPEAWAAPLSDSAIEDIAPDPQPRTSESPALDLEVSIEAP